MRVASPNTLPATIAALGACTAPTAAPALPIGGQPDTTTANSVCTPTPRGLAVPRGAEVGPPSTASARKVWMLKNRVLLTVAIVVASYVPAASALALSGANHNETLRLDA